MAANRLANRVVTALAPKRFRGARLLVLETVGRRSGRARRTPLPYVEVDNRYLVVASNGGANWEPAWLLNLRASPNATIRVGRGDAVPIKASEVTGGERESLWPTLNEAFDYDAYQARVNRQLKVVALTPDQPWNSCSPPAAP